MRSARADQIRALAQALSDNGKKEITAPLFYAATGAEDAAAKACVRRCVDHMVRRGELERVKDGVFRFVPGKSLAVQRNGEGYKRMWRIIRTEKAGWTMTEVCALTGMEYSTVNHYCRWLEREGYIDRCGKQGNTILYRGTEKAHQQRETPYPPLAPKDPFEKEKNAASRLVRLFMLPNPADSRDKIIIECRAILARFETEESHAE